MQPRTEEFLNLLLWSADRLARPTFRNLTDSYESWAYRTGLLRQVAALQKQQLLERDPRFPDDRLYRLSTLGRLHVLGGRDPEERWAALDGQWRLVLFDVPRGKTPSASDCDATCATGALVTCKTAFGSRQIR